MPASVTVKITIIGDGAVGKTCLLFRYKDNDYPGEYIPTVFDRICELHEMKINNKTVKITVDILDTAGDEDYRLSPYQYPGTTIAFICFSIMSKISFNNIETTWIPKMKRYVPDVCIFLIGTKCDLRPRDFKFCNILLNGYIFQYFGKNKFIPNDIKKIIISYIIQQTVKNVIFFMIMNKNICICWSNIPPYKICSGYFDSFMVIISGK